MHIKNLIFKAKSLLSNCKVSQRCGLTLIEVLITVSLISLLSLVLYTSLVNGMKVWKKSQELVAEEDIVIFFDKIGADLRNVVSYEGLSCLGTETSFAFPALVSVLADPNSGFRQDEYVDQIGTVKYFFDKETGSLYREVANYSLALKGDFLSKRKIAGNITDFRLQYFSIEKNKEVKSKEIEEIIPYAVKIEVQFTDGKQPKVLNKYISIPLGHR